MNTNNDSDMVWDPSLGKMVRRAYADGEVVRVPLALMDSMQLAVAGLQDRSVQDEKAQALADHQEWTRRQASGQFDDGDPRSPEERALHRRCVRDNASAGQFVADAAKTQAQGVQAHVDHYAAKAAKRDHDLTRNGYSASLDFTPPAPRPIY